MLRRRYLQVVLTILIGILLAGCSGSAANETGQFTSQAPGLTAGTPTQSSTATGNAPATENATPTAGALQASPAAATIPPTGALQASPAAATVTATAGEPTPAALPVTGATQAPAATPQSCQATAADALGPFYVPGAPERSQVGQGYILTGVVRSVVDCAPIPGAMVELWMAGPDGNYADAYRATIVVGPDGAYRFESHAPPPYSGRPPHIHLRVTADGYAELVTQHYPGASQTQASFDLVLQPR